jgi:hypothetical protein
MKVPFSGCLNDDVFLRLETALDALNQSTLQTIDKTSNFAQV